MAYEPKTWQSFPSTQTPILATDLNHIEQGIATADAAATGAEAAATAAQATADAAVPNTTEGRQALADSTELKTTYVSVRTSDGQPLAPGTIVVITLDKTLAQITATPVADIADITFEEV